MFSKGDVVSYGANGVCRIDGEWEEKFKGEKKRYLVLKPIYQENSTVFVPLDNQSLLDSLKNLLTSDEVNSLIDLMPTLQPNWIDDDVKRTDYFRQVIKNGDREELAKMVIALHRHREFQLSKGRKLHASDERFLKGAEKILFDEFAVVLGISPDEVAGFIRNKVKNVC